MIFRIFAAVNKLYASISPGFIYRSGETCSFEVVDFFFETYLFFIGVSIFLYSIGVYFPI